MGIKDKAHDSLTVYMIECQQFLQLHSRAAGLGACVLALVLLGAETIQAL